MKKVLWFLAASVVAALVLAQPTGWLGYLVQDPQGVVAFRALTHYSEAPMVGFGTTAPTVANSGSPPLDGELYTIDTAAAVPVLTKYNVTGTVWHSMLVSELSTNAPDITNSVWFTSGGIVGEGTTADANEFTVSADEPVADQTFLFNSVGAVNTAVLLDTGIAPANGNTLPANDWSDVIHSRHQTAIYFRQSPAWGSGAPPTGGGLVVCDNTAGLNYIWTPSFPYYLELDSKGDNTACAPTWAAATGMNMTTDAAAENEGFEITAGITAASPAAFVVGTDPPFYMKVVLDQAVVAESDQFYCGFRLAEGYQDATSTAYNTYFSIGYGDLADGADYNIQQLDELDGGVHRLTDLSGTHGVWAGAAVHTLEVRVDAAGNVNGYYDGAEAAEALAFAITAADVVVPYCFILNDDDAAAQAINFYRMEWGLQ